MKRTFSGVDIRQFANEPTAAELAGIIADLPSEKIADFFCELAQQIRNQYYVGDSLLFQNVAADLQALEDKLCDGGGSRLLRELASSLKEHA